MIEFYITPLNTSPVEDLSCLEVQVAIAYSGPVGPNGEKYITPQMANEEEVKYAFSRIRTSLDLAEQRALAVLNENKE